MGYLHSHAHLRCDYCQKHRKVRFDNIVIAKGLSTDHGKAFTMEVINASSEDGRCFDYGNLYACHTCYMQALEALPDDPGLSDKDIMEWLDDHIHPHLETQ